ncbi:MAG TPA: GAF domain-containing protein [Anaerolineae bacterium]|nr:GAF domain-containing protein [Anaerolineae bacterium]
MDAPSIYPHTILVVDDNPATLRMMALFFNRRQLNTITAQSGYEALEIAAAQDPDLILLDIMMPDMDGYVTCQKLKENPATQAIPVIFMTALTDASHKVRGFEVGAVDYVTKPVQYEVVLARINTHIRLRDLNRQIARRAAQLEITNEIGQHMMGILDLDTLIPTVLHQIQSQFSFYFVGVWLLQGDDIILNAGASREGDSWVPSGYRISIVAEQSAIAHACRTGEQYLVTDTNQDPHYLPSDHLPNTRTELALPLKVGKRIIGALDIQSETANSFSPEDQWALQLLANQVATAFHNASIYQNERARRQLVERVQGINQLITSTLKLEEVLDLILFHLKDIVHHDRGAVLLHENDVLNFMAVRGFAPDADYHNWQIPLAKPEEGELFFQIYHTKKPFAISDVAQFPGWRRVEDVSVPGSWLGVPIIHQDEVIGMLSLAREEIDPFDTESITFATTFAAQTAVAIRNANLYAQITQFNHQLEAQVQARTQELEQAYKQLEIMDQSKSDFIGIASHELRTPISVITGYSQILLEQSEANNHLEYLPFLQKIDDGIDRLNEIVSSMLDVAKIDTQDFKLYTDTTSLQLLCESVATNLEKAFTDRQITLTLTPSLRQIPRIEADPSALQKVFYQLVVNAIKYTPDGGQIIIEARSWTKSPHPDWPERGVEVKVKDTGIGINEKDHELIFSKFYQTGKATLHSSGKTKFKGGGPGLGLAIARGIVLAHQGHIWVTSSGHDENNLPGSTFHVVLPLKHTPPPIPNK